MNACTGYKETFDQPMATIDLQFNKKLFRGYMILYLLEAFIMMYAQTGVIFTYFVRLQLPHRPKKIDKHKIIDVTRCRFRHKTLAQRYRLNVSTPFHIPLVGS